MLKLTSPLRNGVLVAVLMVVVAGCDNDPAQPWHYWLAPLMVLSALGQSLTVSAKATQFTFATPVAAGTAYNVQVQTQPSGQTCSVSNGSALLTAVHESGLDFCFWASTRASSRDRKSVV